MPPGFKITERTRQVKGGGTETKFALYEGDKYRGIFATKDEAITAAKPAAPPAAKTAAPTKTEARETGPSDSGPKKPGRALAQAIDRPVPGLYSAVLRVIEGAKQAKAIPTQWLGMLRNAPGVKPEEMQWLGLADWLKEQKGAVTKEQVADFVRANQIEVREVEKGGSGERLAELQRRQEEAQREYFGPNPPEGAGTRLDQANAELEAAASEAQSAGPKFASYTLPGGENYRELLLTLPARADEGQNYRVPAAHAYDDEAADVNRLAHIFFDDRVIDGKKTLLIKEAQSDWHQGGRKRRYKEPYRSDELTPVRANDPLYGGLSPEDSNLILVRAPDNVYQIAKSNRPDRKIETFEDAKKYVLENKTKGGGDIPDAPFKTTWPELIMKRMIRYAAENGYDKLAWVPGAERAERYDLSKQIEKLEYIKEANGLYNFTAYAKDNNQVIRQRDVPADKLSDYFGKEVADRMLKNEGAAPYPKLPDARSLSGLDLKVGGEGMSGFMIESCQPQRTN